MVSPRTSPGRPAAATARGRRHGPAGRGGVSVKGVQRSGARVALAIGAVLLGLAPAAVGAEDKLPTISKVTEGYQAAQGFFHVYRKKNRLLIEVPRGRIDRPFLLATSVSGGSPMAGWQWTDALVEWQRLDRKLLLVEKNVRYRANRNDPLHEVVQRTYTDRLIKAVPIGAEEPGSPRRGVLIDGNRLFAQYASAFFGRLGRQLDPSVARITKVKVFPNNVEIAVTMPDRNDGSLVTLYYSLTALPKPGYRPRPADDRVGYFLTAAKDFSRPGSGDRFVRYINRWRLEKADPSLKLSPPKRPIVFYIEKSVPVRYRRFVRAGIEAWNKAFEKIGFTGAIVVRQQTADNEFANLDPEDARYSFFRWITSDQAFAMGPSRVDPRTGEIFDADIIFDDAMVRSYLGDYELMLKRTPGAFFSPRQRELMRRDPRENPLFGTRYFDPGALEAQPLFGRHDLGQRGLCSLGEGIQHQLGFANLVLAAAKKPETKEEPWPEEFLGAMIQEVVMHEVGHTLGLRHNFAASTLRDLSEINSDKAPRVLGGSVMDYNPVNVAGPDETQGQYITRDLGPYDYWAIEYGYKPVKNDKELEAIAKRATRPELAYATDEDADAADPYVNRFDLGKDPLAYAKKRTALARWLLSDVEKRILRDGDDYARLRRAVNMLTFEVLFSGALASRFVGGERYYRFHKGDPGAKEPIEPVAADKQREALRFICDEILSAKAFELPAELLRKLRASRWSHWGVHTSDPGYDYEDRVFAMQALIVGRLLDPERLDRVADQRYKVADPDKALTLGELFDTLTDAIFSEFAPASVEAFDADAGPLVSPLRRNLQRAYLGWLIRVAVEGRGAGPAITRALAYAELTKLQDRFQDAVQITGLDPETRAYVQESLVRSRKALEASYQAQ
ncbi:MAG: DUF5117 domain-containing protein [Planctomycetota bacterium]|nr:MAG: DUF5117 domain-containing protein [Planctomycetota bacterium]